MEQTPAPPHQAPDNLTKEEIPQEENPATATITVAIIEVPELTEEEQRDRLHLERRVERAFFETGKVLAELRDRRLHRSSHRTFEDYCRDRLGFPRLNGHDRFWLYGTSPTIFVLCNVSRVYQCMTCRCWR